MAAAEGTVLLVLATLGPLLGLASVEFLRERSPDFGRAPVDACWRWDGRAGEVSREDCGEFAFDGEPDAVREREPLRAWCRIWGATSPLSDAGTGGRALFAVGSWMEAIEAWGAGVVVEVLAAAGSADSAAPVMERKESSSLAEEVMVMVMA